jgi:hypothetical protein
MSNRLHVRTWHKTAVFMVYDKMVVERELLLWEKSKRYEYLKANCSGKHLGPKKYVVKLKCYIKCSFVMSTGHLMLCARLILWGWDGVSLLLCRGEESNARRVLTKSILEKKKKNRRRSRNLERNLESDIVYSKTLTVTHIDQRRENEIRVSGYDNGQWMTFAYGM